MAADNPQAPNRRMDIDSAERAVDRAFSTGKVDRAVITRQAREDAKRAMEMADVAIESDEVADEAAKLAIITSNMGNREKAKAARDREREARRKAHADHKAATKSAKRAYDAIKFSDPNSLGFLRVVQVGFLFKIVFTIVSLLLTSRDTIAYTPSTILNWVFVVLDAVAFYFFVNRYKLGRPMVMAISGLSIVANLVLVALDPGTTFGSVFFNILFDLFLLLYFAFSDRVKAELVNDLASDPGATDIDEIVIDRKSWPFWRNNIIYFIVFSILGHWLEASYCLLIKYGLAPGEFHAENTMLWRDWFYPYPMHGTAVVLMGLILYPLFLSLKKRFKGRLVPYLASYGANVLTVTIIELAGGLMFNANLQNWDYTNMPFNFLGQVCLTNSLLFGVAASIITWWVYPMCERFIARVRPATMNIAFVVIAIIGALLFSLYVIAPPEGIDLGENGTDEAAQQVADELDVVMAGLTLTKAGAQTLGDGLANASHLDQEKVQQMSQQLVEVNKMLDELKVQADGLSAQGDAAQPQPQEQPATEEQSATEGQPQEQAAPQEQVATEEQPQEQQ
ncbi:MAG: hypothetical protein J6S63_07315 [Atopobiaceae bacterium]|nr:hypothetical protein [Atopobiaceae bacterium]